MYLCKQFNFNVLQCNAIVCVCVYVYVHAHVYNYVYMYVSSPQRRRNRSSKASVRLGGAEAVDPRALRPFVPAATS